MFGRVFDSLRRAYHPQEERGVSAEAMLRFATCGGSD
jgi:hypothetical protein